MKRIFTLITCLLSLQFANASSGLLPAHRILTPAAFYKPELINDLAKALMKITGISFEQGKSEFKLATPHTETHLYHRIDPSYREAKGVKEIKIGDEIMSLKIA